MRHIPLGSHIPDESWRREAEVLRQKLVDAEDASARNEIIDSNSNLWAELKPWLLNLSHGKCWFSESKDVFSHYDVEHYRPKKSARSEAGITDGYWWLAFDWMNFRVCGNVGNRKKGAYFPLRPGCHQARPHGDLRYEDPQLLDPTDEHDPGLLSFNMEGEAVPASHLVDAWEKSRVIESVVRYKLDFPPLTDKRKLIWNECWSRIRDYLTELEMYHTDHTNVIARDRVSQAAKRIREMMHAEMELSAVARACVFSTGDRRVLGLLQSL